MEEAAEDEDGDAEEQGQPTALAAEAHGGGHDEAATGAEQGALGPAEGETRGVDADGGVHQRGGGVLERGGEKPAADDVAAEDDDEVAELGPRGAGDETGDSGV